MYRPKPRGGERWAAYVWPGGVAGLQDVLASSGLDLARVRADTTPVIRELPALQVSLEAQIGETISDTATAPNVVGILEGSDSALKKEYIVFSAHMDHIGISRVQADSINNGADDNASGVAGLIELAQAFSQPGVRPKRSLIFLATSGGAKGSWGSRSFISSKI